VRHCQLQAKPSTQIAAFEWVERNVPTGSRLAVEFYGPPVLNLSKSRTSELMQQGDFARAYHLWNTDVNAAVRGTPEALEPDPIAQTQALGIEYVCLDSYTGDRFGTEAALRTHPEKVQQRRRFYDWVRQSGELVQVFSPAELDMQGPRIEIYRLRPSAEAIARPWSDDTAGEGDDS